MLDRNLLDEAAQVLAKPIPRRKALRHLAAGFAGALLLFVWPEQAQAGRLPVCNGCKACHNDLACTGKYAGASCTTSGKKGYCSATFRCNAYTKISCCKCIPGSAAPDVATIPDVTLTREASLAAGNCQEGTDWVLSWFPGRDSVSAREAAAEAIARGEPWLARDIARTAHLVQRSAQV